MNIEDLKSNIEIDDSVEGRWYWIRVLNKSSVVSVTIDGETITDFEELIINEAKLIKYRLLSTGLLVTGLIFWGTRIGVI